MTSGSLSGAGWRDTLLLLAHDRFWQNAARDTPGALVVLILPFDYFLVATTYERGAIDYLVDEGRRFTETPQLEVWRGDWQPYQP